MKNGVHGSSGRPKFRQKIYAGSRMGSRTGLVYTAVATALNLGSRHSGDARHFYDHGEDRA